VCDCDEKRDIRVTASFLTRAVQNATKLNVQYSIALGLVERVSGSGKGVHTSAHVNRQTCLIEAPAQPDTRGEDFSRLRESQSTKSHFHVKRRSAQPVITTTESRRSTELGWEPGVSRICSKSKYVISCLAEDVALFRAGTPRRGGLVRWTR